MKKITVLLTVLLAVCLAAAFAGCGSSDEEADIQSESGAFSFETTDLEGNTVSSADLFAQNRVTMINVWGTFCGPCIQEMPELEAIHQKYAQQGGGTVGVVLDVTVGDEGILQDAEDIVEETGVTYTNLLPWDDETLMNVEAIPTTFFVDREGKILGEPIVGADPDQYRARMDQYLEEEQ